MHHQTHDAYETFGSPTEGPFFVTCEHASNRVPAPLRTTELDRAWMNSHWGYDIGARTLSLELIRRTGSYGVLARYSRLVCDANREPGHPDLIRTSTAGHHLSFNRRIDDTEMERRLTAYHAPYHAGIDEGLRARLAVEAGDVLLNTMRAEPTVTFTGCMVYPVIHKAELMEISVKTIEIDRSGREGLIYAAERHGSNHQVVFLELEVNQSLTCTPARARRTGRRIADALSRLHLRHRARLLGP